MTIDEMSKQPNCQELADKNRKITVIREEQIEQKAKELGQKYFPDEYNIWARPNYEAQYVESACKEMVEWLAEKMQEEKQLLLQFLKKADENGQLNIYDGEENYHKIKWMFFDGEKLLIKIN